MSVKQMKWHAAVLAVTVIAVLAALFALATVTSNAAVTKTEDDQGNPIYTMTGGTYDEQIVLKKGTTTTINISGVTELTYAGGAYIAGEGNLIITGSGTLETPNGVISCNDFTMSGGAKLKDVIELIVTGNATINNAYIEAPDGYMECGNNSSGKIAKHVFDHAGLELGMNLVGESVLTDCNVTINKSAFNTVGGQLTIDGGTYNFAQGTPPMAANSGAIIKNAVIKMHTFCVIMGLEMTDSTLEIAMPEETGSQGFFMPPAMYGYNMSFSGSKIKITGKGMFGIFAVQQLIMTNTEANIEGANFGILSNDVKITRSSGTIRATDPTKAYGAIIAADFMSDPEGTVSPGTITLNETGIKEPAGGIVKVLNADMTFSPGAPIEKYDVTTISAGDTPANTVVLANTHTTHTWDAGKVTKQPTETAEGVKTYTCTVCGATKTEAIPKLATNGEDGTPFGKGASVAAAEAAILALPSDNDPAGTAFGLLQLKSTKVTKNSINLKWKAVPGATKYIIFANKCGTGNKYKKLIEVTGTSLNVTQAAGAALKKGTYYKFMMIAADANGKVVSTSKTVHAATKGGKIGNHKKVTVKKSVTKKAKKLKKGKTLKLKAKAVPQAKKLKVRKHRGIKYESSNPAVAKVNGKGSVKGVGKGTCYIYAYAQNGTCAKVKVTVK